MAFNVVITVTSLENDIFLGEERKKFPMTKYTYMAVRSSLLYLF